MKKPSRGYKGDVVTSLFGKRDTILPDKLLHVRVLCVRGTRAVLFFFFSHFVFFFFVFLAVVRACGFMMLLLMMCPGGDVLRRVVYAHGG